jgi:hypothetical protein
MLGFVLAAGVDLVVGLFKPEIDDILVWFCPSHHSTPYVAIPSEEE